MISIVEDVLKNEVTRPGMRVYAVSPEAAQVILMVAGKPDPQVENAGTVVWGLSIWNGKPMSSPVYMELHVTELHSALFVPLVHDERAKPWLHELMGQKLMLEPVRHTA